MSIAPATYSARKALDVEDFDATISSPWDATEIELHFTGAHRRAWAALPGIDVEHGHEQDPDEEPQQWTRFIGLPLGSVRAVRRMVTGGEDDLGEADVRLRLDPGAEEGEITVSTKASPAPWAPALTNAFHAVVRALASAKIPSAIRGLRAREPKLTAAALIRDGWADQGAEVALRCLDRHWNPGVELDVARLLGPDARTADPEEGRPSMRFGSCGCGGRI